MTIEENFKQLSLSHYGKEQRRDYGVPKSITFSSGKRFAVFKNCYDEWGDLEYEFLATSSTEAYEINEANNNYWGMKLMKLSKKISKERRRQLKEFRYDLTSNQYSYERKKHYDIMKWWSITNEMVDSNKIKHFNYINHLIKREEIMKMVRESKMLSKDEKRHLDYMGKIIF